MKRSVPSCNSALGTRMEVSLLTPYFQKRRSRLGPLRGRTAGGEGRTNPPPPPLYCRILPQLGSGRWDVALYSATWLLPQLTGQACPPFSSCPSLRSLLFSSSPSTSLSPPSTQGICVQTDCPISQPVQTSINYACGFYPYTVTVLVCRRGTCPQGVR